MVITVAAPLAPGYTAFLVCAFLLNPKQTETGAYDLLFPKYQNYARDKLCFAKTPAVTAWIHGRRSKVL